MGKERVSTMGSITCPARVTMGAAVLLVIVFVGSVCAEEVITDAPRPSAELSRNGAEPTIRKEPGLTHEAFGVRDGMMEGFIINASEETVEDATVEIRSTSADEMLTYWMVRVPLGDMDPGQRVFVQRAYPEWFSRPEQIVFVFDPPENPDTPWPRPVQAERLRYSGSDSGLTSWFTMSPGAVRFSFRHDGAGDFHLELIALGEVDRIPVARHSGTGKGSSLLDVQEQRIVQLVVKATGRWEVRIDKERVQSRTQPAGANEHSAPGEPAQPLKPIRIEERSSGDIRITH